jgi:hypothetical protein
LVAYREISFWIQFPGMCEDHGTKTTHFAR